MGDVDEVAVMAERVGSQSDQCLVHPDAQLDGDHAGSLVHGETEVRPDLELRPDGPRLGAGLHAEDRPSRHVRHDQCIGVLVGAQRPGWSR